MKSGLDFIILIALSKFNLEKEETSLFINELSTYINVDGNIDYFINVADKFNNLKDKDKIREWCIWLKFQQKMEKRFNMALISIKKQFFHYLL